MAHLIQRADSAYWWASWTGPDGRRRRKSLGVRVDSGDGRRRALRLLEPLRAEEEAAKDEQGGGLFSAWVARWMEVQYANPGTLQRYQAAWRSLAVYLERRQARHPGDVTYSLAREYMGFRTAPPKGAGIKARNWNTALVELRFLGAVMQEAVRRGLVVANPCARLGLSRRDVKKKSEITREEEVKIRRLLETPSTPEWMRDSFAVAMAQGCRLSETRVPMADVDETRGVIAFRCKGGVTRAAPLHPDLASLAARRRADGATHLVDVPAKLAGKAWWSWFKDNGLGHLCFHSTRVTVVTRLARAGVSMAEAMEYVGHASEVVHAVYRRLQPADMGAAVEALRRLP
jgi:integrase